MPQRFLRPGITTSQRFNAITYDAQSLFLRLMTLVDDFGRYDADLRLLRSHAFPYGDPFGKEIKPKTIENMCEQLSAAGLAVFYTAEGKPFLQLLRWEERPRAQSSKYPAFTESCEQMFASASKCMPPSSSSSSSSLSHRHSTNGFHKPNVPDPSVWIADLEKSEAYKGINVRREFAKMIEWGKLPRNKKKKLSRARFISWLNRIEPPINTDERPKMDKAKIDVAPQFKEWASKKYPAKAEEIGKWKVWAQVPDHLRTEWWREEQPRVMAGIAKDANESAA